MLTTACLVLTLACNDPFSPEELPEGAVWTRPQPMWAEEYARAESCSGRKGNFEQVQWYVVPGVDAFTMPNERIQNGYYGLTFYGRHIIIIAGDHVNSTQLIRHESLHDILQTGKHPEVPFVYPCDAYHEGTPG